NDCVAINIDSDDRTQYSDKKTDKEYARVDQGPNSDCPGYLTHISQKATNGMMLSLEEKVLTDHEADESMSDNTEDVTVSDSTLLEEVVDVNEAVLNESDDIPEQSDTEADVPKEVAP
ncbi:MAG: hypothetical protein Q4B75_10630, partial [Eubacteriales bacterium]|nr:hypothetical protein [Eubacteriales bacterium]